MAIAILKIKVMPEQKYDLEKLKKEIQDKISQAKGSVNKIEEEEVAFGLKCLIATIAWPEEKNTEEAEQAIKNIKGVSSLDIIDYRRAFG